MFQATATSRPGPVVIVFKRAFLRQSNTAQWVVVQRHDNAAFWPQQRRQQSSSSSSSSTTTSGEEEYTLSSKPYKPSWLERMSLWVQSKVMDTDDQSDPKKLLERRYLFFGLLSLRLRDLRRRQKQQHQQRAAGQPSPQSSQRSLFSALTKDKDDDESLANLSVSELKWRSVEQLDQEGLDKLSNVHLRQAYQAAMEPQLRHVLQTFAAVDKDLFYEPSEEVPPYHDNNNDTDENTDQTSDREQRPPPPPQQPQQQLYSRSALPVHLQQRDHDDDGVTTTTLPSTQRILPSSPFARMKADVEFLKHVLREEHTQTVDALQGLVHQHEQQQHAVQQLRPDLWQRRRTRQNNTGSPHEPPPPADDEKQTKKHAEQMDVLRLLENQLGFLRTKQGALEMLLDFHGMSTGTSSTSSSTLHKEEEEEEEEDVITALALTSRAVAMPTYDFFGMPSEDDDHDAELDPDKEERLILIRQYQTLNLCRSALLRQALGYSVVCLRSTIPHAGRGVFVDGTAHTGDLVAFQPGQVWAREHLETDKAGGNDDDPVTAAGGVDAASELHAHFASTAGEEDDDCLVSMRFDDFLLDARASPVTVLTERDGGSFNPWALGHMVNHPPAKRHHGSGLFNEALAPNCQSLALNFSDAVLVGKKKYHETAIKSYIPNSYARPLTWRTRWFQQQAGGGGGADTILAHGLSLVARSDITNQELHYDYRLQATATPDWYQPVPDDELPQLVFYRPPPPKVDDD